MKYEDQFRIKSAWERRKKRGETLKKGDKVVMHTGMVADHYDGKIWEVTCDEYFQHGNALVSLKGFLGSFAARFLQKIKMQDDINPVYFVGDLDDPINQKVLESAIEKWGEEEQLGMFLEESLELSIAVRKLLRARKHGGSVIEKMIEVVGGIADVRIMIERFFLMYPGAKAVCAGTIDRKIKRLEKRISESEF